MASDNALENNFFNPNSGYVAPGFNNYASLVVNIEKGLEQQCGAECSMEEREKAYQQAGVTTYKPISEEAENLHYLIPGFGLVYGAADALNEGEWRPFLISAAGTASAFAGVMVHGTKMIVGISMGANGTYQLVTKPASDFNLIDLGAAGVAGWLTQGKNLLGNAAISGAVSGTAEAIKGEEILPGIIGGAAGGAGGSVTGTGATNILKPVTPPIIAGVAGEFVGAVSGEFISDYVQSLFKGKDKNENRDK